MPQNSLTWFFRATLLCVFLCCSTGLWAATGTVKGKVASISVDGNGPNSAQLLFVITDAKGNNRALVVLAYPSTEPQVFTAMTSILTTAIALKAEVTVGYETLPGRTDRALSVELVPPGGSPAPPGLAHPKVKVIHQ